ncbi:MAG: tRNA (adenosine(37)-N6)-dimethylallyltransferase MiaA [Nitrospirae bacterium]|nr:tRNA (adenosine(37)-N6)-dimethylallyltransferase MiaA [Nitrospirota bacterium]
MIDVRASKPVLILVGPTAVGKSRLAMEIAGRLGTEIISADSRQVYRGMDIGTAKPSAGDRTRIRHHLIDVADPDERFDAGSFRSLAGRIIEGLHLEGKIPLVVGGTGLYVRTLTRGLCGAPKADLRLRKSLLLMETEQGEGALYRELVHVDPVSARKIHPKDQVRIIRALEVYRLTGLPISSWQEDRGKDPSDHRVVLIGLTMDRAALYRKIERRVDEMVSAGLEMEVRGLLARGYDEHLPALQGVGYKQWLGYFRGDYGKEEVVRLLKRDTRRYAKRQMTWFRQDSTIRWIPVRPDEDSARKADEVIGMLLDLFLNPLTERSAS